MDPRTATGRAAHLRRRRRRRRRRRPPARRRPPSAVYLGAAVAGAVLVNVLVGADPRAHADTGRAQSVSVAQQLGCPPGRARST